MFTQRHKHEAIGYSRFSKITLFLTTQSIKCIFFKIKVNEF
jgi:hypothetical protein